MRKIKRKTTKKTESSPQRPDLAVTVQLTQSDTNSEMMEKIEEALKSFDTPNVQYAYSTHIGTRDSQQDYVDAGTGENGIIYGIVCDGMGGLEGGEVASRKAGQALTAVMLKMDPKCNIPAFLTDMVHYINKFVCELPFKSNDGNGAGTTLVATVIIGKCLYWISIGDSRIYIIRNNEIEAVTRDHSYSMQLNEQVLAGTKTPDEAASDPMRDALISFLGIDKLKIIDSNKNPFLLEPGDIILICSDGLYRSLNEHEIMSVIKRHSDNIEECARVLPLYAYDKSPGGQDNTSVVLIKSLR